MNKVRESQNGKKSVIISLKVTNGEKGGEEDVHFQVCRVGLCAIDNVMMSTKILLFRLFEDLVCWRTWVETYTKDCRKRSLGSCASSTQTLNG